MATILNGPTSCTTAAVFSELRNQLASLERHAKLTRCFTALAELLVLCS